MAIAGTSHSWCDIDFNDFNDFNKTP